MADERKGRKPTPEEEALLLGEEEEQDGIFRAQMWLANFFLGYWKHGLGVLGLFLLASLAYGTWQNHIRDTQRDIQAAMARIDRTLPDPNPAYPLLPMYDTAKPEVAATITKAAEDMEAVAADATGAGQVLAWVRAGQLWELVDDADKAGACFIKAHEAGGEGAVGWSAGARAAKAKARAGDVDGAVAILREFAAQPKGVTAHQALHDIGLVYLDAGRTDEALKTFDEFNTRFPESPLTPRVALAMEAARSTGG